MEESIRNAISPVLVEFCDEQHHVGRNICRAKAPDVAAVFRETMNLPCPLTWDQRGWLLQQLRYPEVYARPGLERETNNRGTWGAFGDKSWIFIDDARPPQSQLKTFLHELVEQALEYSASLLKDPPPMSVRMREDWANSFAAHCKMPPERFRRDALQCGLDLWWLKENYVDTIAGVSRHIRDVVMQHSSFYVCRFDVVTNPERHCVDLLPALNESGGICIRVADVARTKRMDISRRCGGGLPLYNLPATDHYRVLHPAMHEYVKSRRPVFIPSIKGASGLEFGWSDLFADQDLAFLIRPYGYSRTRGFVLMAVHVNDSRLLDVQLEKVEPDIRRDIPSLFSWASSTKAKHKEPGTQKNLAITDSRGKGLDQLGTDLLRWPCESPEDNPGESHNPDGNFDIDSGDSPSLWRSIGQWPDDEGQGAYAMG